MAEKLPRLEVFQFDFLSVGQIWPTVQHIWYRYSTTTAAMKNTAQDWSENWPMTCPKIMTAGIRGNVESAAAEAELWGLLLITRTNKTLYRGNFCGLTKQKHLRSIILGSKTLNGMNVVVIVKNVKHYSAGITAVLNKVNWIMKRLKKSNLKVKVIIEKENKTGQ